MTTMHSHTSRRRLDIASLALLLIGVIFGALSWWLIAHDGASPLLLIPSIVAATIGVTHITKLEAPRD